MNLNYGFEHAEIYNESNQKYYEYYKRSQVQEEMIDKIKQETRRYAKRQNTWFKRDNSRIRLNALDGIQNNINIILEEYGERKGNNK